MWVLLSYFFNSLHVFCRPSYVSVFLGSVVYFSLQKGDGPFCVSMFVSVIYFSLQMCCGPFMWICWYLLFISLCRCVVVLLWEYVCKYMLFNSFADVLWSFYGSMFVSIFYWFLFADVLWSFYGSMFLSICYLFLLHMCCGPFMWVCL